MEPVIIEVRVNETAERAGRPHLPLTPAEIVDDAVAAREAGASILHWHARDPGTGDPRNDVDLFREVYEGARARTDLLLHPTLGYLVDQDPETRTRHIAAVNDDPVLRVDLAPVDFGSINVDHWDARANRWMTEDLVYINTRSSLRRMLETFQRLDVTVVSVCWNAGQLRTARCFRELGLLGRTLWEFVFTGDRVPEGTPPTPKALEALVEQVPDGEPWSTICWNGDGLEVAAWSIALGGHVSIGLGDWHYPELGTPTNAEVVSEVVRLCEAAGRPVATPGDARRILGLRAASRT